MSAAAPILITSLEGGHEQPVGTWHPHPRSGGVFIYDTSWVANGYALSPTLPLVTGAQSLVAEAGRIPQVFSDSAPDRWGRGVIQRAWQNEGRGKPSDIDCLLAVNDRLRMGALRYTRGGEDLNAGSRIPKMLDLERLEAAARRTEDDLDDDEDIAVLFNAGSSLGGARPKAVIVDEHGHLMLAKFTSTKDTTETIAWEKVCLDIAARSGIRTPRSKLLRIANRPVLVMDRFDREYTNDGTEHRIGYMSAMTLVDETDGGSSSMTQIADEFETIAAPSGVNDTKEIWSRTALNLLVGNTDNHLRNHGFLRAKNGWRLAPAFDITPATSKVDFATPIDEGSPDNIDTLMDCAGLFGLSNVEAKERLTTIVSTVDHWQEFARTHEIPEREDRRVAPGFVGPPRQQARNHVPDTPTRIDLAPAPGSTETACTRCGRPLRSAESIARGVGPSCANHKASSESPGVPRLG